MIEGVVAAMPGFERARRPIEEEDLACGFQEVHPALECVGAWRADDEGRRVYGARVQGEAEEGDRGAESISRA